jgi:hypothetical protein
MDLLARFLEQHRNPRFTRDLLADRADRVTVAGSLGLKDLGVSATALENKALNIIRRYRRPIRFDEIIEAHPKQHGTASQQ